MLRVSLPIFLILGSLAADCAAQAIVADHNAVQEFDQIPDYWLEQARQLTIHFGHTSHGSQIIAGANYLRDHVDPVKYNFSVRGRNDGVGLPPAENPPALGMWEQGSWPYDYWSTPEGRDATRATVSTGLFDVSGWAWCGQVADCASYLECEDDQYIFDYLTAMGGFEQEFPDATFFYMTGHAVNQGGKGNNDDRLLRNNQRIRDHSTAENKVLFDFADIERWDPDGNDHLMEDDDSCQWCYDWCAAHPEDCVDLPENDWEASCGSNECTGCAHSHGLNCVNKAKAFWWMMARLAGWDGVGDSDGDVDSDGVVDALDNCLLVPNAGQCDTDADGYGNMCDTDYDDNGMSGAGDLGALKLRFGCAAPAACYDEEFDADCSGGIGVVDLSEFRSKFGLPPGPSGRSCAGAPPC